MALTRVECGFTECDYISENASEQVALMQFQSHMAVHQQSQVSRPATTKQKLPPIERPKLKQDINEEEWDTLHRNGSASSAAQAFQSARRLTNSLIAAREVLGAFC